MRRVARIAAGLCGCTALAGCAVDVPSRSAAIAGMTPVAAVTRVAESARATRSASYDFHFNGPLGTGLSGHGSYRSAPKPAMDMVFDSASVAGLGALKGMEERLVDDSLYLKLPTLGSLLGGKWLKVSLADSSGALGNLLDQSVQVDPGKQLQALLAAPEVHVVGPEVIDGVPTTHYAGDVTVADIEKHTDYDAATKAALGKLYGGPGGQVTQLNVWVDAQSRARRFTTATPTSAGPIAMSMTFTGYDQPVTVTAPDPADVTDMSDSIGGQITRHSTSTPGTF